MWEGKWNGTGRNILDQGSVITQWGMKGLTHSQLRAPVTMGISLQPNPRVLIVWPWEGRGREEKREQVRVWLFPGFLSAFPRHTHTRSPDRIACSHTFRSLSCASSSFTRFSERWERSHKCQSPSNEPFVYRGNKKYACVTRILPVLSVNCNYLSPQTYFGIIWFPKYSAGENYLIQSPQRTSVSILHQT